MSEFKCGEQRVMRRKDNGLNDVFRVSIDDGFLGFWNGDAEEHNEPFILEDFSEWSLAVPKLAAEKWLRENPSE